ncbi:hypothetical protein HanPSC8_Chr04g0177301 [Helianthus annuus]|nr:hypothetical protein HanPSC8_Chr04g0177301 [Helianthus annuus]
MSRWMGALKANGLRRLNQVSEREYGRAKVVQNCGFSSWSVKG